MPLTQTESLQPLIRTRPPKHQTLDCFERGVPRAKLFPELSLRRHRTQRWLLHEVKDLAKGTCAVHVTKNLFDKAPWIKSSLQPRLRVLQHERQIVVSLDQLHEILAGCLFVDEDGNEIEIAVSRLALRHAGREKRVCRDVPADEFGDSVLFARRVCADQREELRLPRLEIVLNQIGQHPAMPV